MVDPGFGVNAFNKPKILNESQTLANTLLRLLFGRPGFYPSIPSLGIAIQDSIYKFFDDIDTDALKAKIAYQCEYFIPSIRNGDLEIIKTKLQGSSEPFLAITIPITIERSNLRLIIGISTNSKGEMVYNFRYMDE